MSNFNFLLLPLILASICAVSAIDFTCNATISSMPGDSPSNFLVVLPGEECVFRFIYESTKPKSVNVKLDNLAMLSNVSLFVHRMEPEPEVQYNYSSPSNPGYLRLTQVSESRIVFTVQEQVRLELYIDVEKLDISCRENREFELLLTEPKQRVDFNCINPKPYMMSHVELSQAIFLNSTLHHNLVWSGFSILPLDNRVSIKVASASPECSKEYVNQDELVLSPPVRQFKLEPLRCVNTFTLTNSKTHFDLNFQTLIDTLAAQDSLTIDLGNPSDELIINKASQSLFNTKTFSSLGKQMSIIYHSLAEPTNSYKLSVKSRDTGGVIQLLDATPINLNLAGIKDLARFTVKPPSSTMYTLIQFPENITLTGSSVTVSNDKEIIAFFENTYLPAAITSNNPGETLFIEIAGKSAQQLEGMKILPVNSICRKQSFETGSYSLTGNTTTCIWTITSKSGLGLKVNMNDLSSNSCLSIKSLDLESNNSLIYNKCDLTLSDILPTFIFKRAVVQITPSQNTRFNAVLVNRTQPAILKSAPIPPLNISSYGYPLDYAVWPINRYYVLSTLKQPYVVSVLDLDLREGEKLIVNGTVKQEIVSGFDLVIPKNSTSQIAVTKTSKSGSLLDSSNRRGFKLAVSAYDTVILSSNQKSEDILIPENLTSVYVKVSTEPGKKFNFTRSKMSFIDYGMFDASSIYGQRLKLNSSSTSNNMIFTFRSKNNQTIPKMYINYTVIACNETYEHICDGNTRCIPYENLCKGVQFCDDGSDILVKCDKSPIIKYIESGMSTFSTFILCLIMLAIGVCCALYGPNLYKMVDDRLRGGQYSSFTGSE